MHEIESFCKQKIKELKSKQTEWSRLINEFSKLDNKLKAEKRNGRTLTNDDEDVKELMRIGKLVGYSDKDHLATFATYQASIDAYQSVLEELKKKTKK